MSHIEGIPPRVVRAFQWRTGSFMPSPEDLSPSQMLVQRAESDARATGSTHSSLANARLHSLCTAAPKRPFTACTVIKYTAKFRIQASPRRESRLTWPNTSHHCYLTRNSLFRQCYPSHDPLPSAKNELAPFFFKSLKCTLGATDSKQSYRLHRHRFPRHIFQPPRVTTLLL